MNIAIVANGQLNHSLVSAIRRADYIIGVDRAAYWLLQHRVTPDIALGDFDSTSKEELAIIKAKVKTVQEPSHPKYQTDLEMAVEHALSLETDNVTMYGVTGSRLDQTLSAVNLLEQFVLAGVNAKILNPKNEVFLVSSRLTLRRDMSYTYFSVLAHSAKAVVSIRGARYPLTRYMLTREVSLGISNEITAKTATVEVHSGAALVIRSQD